MGCLNWLNRRWSCLREGLKDKKLHPESDFLLTVSELGVSCQRPDGTTESVEFANLQRIEIHTNSLGPILPDVFIVLYGKPGGCVIPMGATNEQALLKKLFALPEFDCSRFIEGMGSTDDREYLVWERK